MGVGCLKSLRITRSKVNNVVRSMMVIEGNEVACGPGPGRFKEKMPKCKKAPGTKKTLFPSSLLQGTFPGQCSNSLPSPPTSYFSLRLPLSFFLSILTLFSHSVTRPITLFFPFLPFSHLPPPFSPCFAPPSDLLLISFTSSRSLIAY